jgi:hypothetical protein
MKNKIVSIIFMCIIIGSISGCGSEVTQTNNPATLTLTPTANNINNSDTDSVSDTNKETGNSEDSNPSNDSNQTVSENTADGQGQDITGAAENGGSDDIDLDDTDISNVKADDYYIGEVINSYYEWFSYAVNDLGEDAEYDLNVINEQLYDENIMSQKIKDWVDAERTQVLKMIYQSYSYGDIQFTSDTELYVTADATYEVTKQDNTVETKDIIKTFYLIEVDGKYKIKDIQDVAE